MPPTIPQNLRDIQHWVHNTGPRCKYATDTVRHAWVKDEQTGCRTRAASTASVDSEDLEANMKSTPEAVAQRIVQELTQADEAAAELAREERHEQLRRRRACRQFGEKIVVELVRTLGTCIVVLATCYVISSINA